MSKRFPAWVALTAVLALSLAPARAREPVNLDTSKTAVRRYVDTGEYAQEVAAVALSATHYLNKRIPRGAKDRKMAVVFDIDETTLSNAPHIIAQDFGYRDEVWDQWVKSAQARAIVPVQVAYDLAVREKVEVFFITGRSESQRAATERNLRDVGYETWTRIFFKPAPAANEKKLTAREYKTGVRRQLTAEGYVIIANFGDQHSDLDGGYAEKTFKLPNPFYLIE